MIWLIGLVVTGVVSIGGLKHHYSDEPGDDEIAPGHSARTPGPVAGIQLPVRSLRPDEISTVRDRIYDIAEAWNFQPRGVVLPPSPLPIAPHFRPLPDLPSARPPSSRAESGIESFVQWLEQQGCVAAVRIPRANVEGAIAYGMTASYPAQVPVEVDLRITPTDDRGGIETYCLYLPLDSAPHVVRTRP